MVKVKSMNVIYGIFQMLFCAWRAHLSNILLEFLLKQCSKVVPCILDRFTLIDGLSYYKAVCSFNDHQCCICFSSVAKQSKHASRLHPSALKDSWLDQL